MATDDYETHLFKLVVQMVILCIFLYSYFICFGWCITQVALITTILAVVPALVPIISIPALFGTLGKNTLTKVIHKKWIISIIICINNYFKNYSVIIINYNDS